MNLNAWIWCAFSEHYPGTEAEIGGESQDIPGKDGRG